MSLPPVSIPPNRNDAGTVKIGWSAPNSAAADRPCDDHHGHQQHPRHVVEGHRRDRGGDRAQDDLSFAADVDHVGTECDADADTDEGERHRPHGGVCEVVGTAEGTRDQLAVGHEGVCAEGEQHDSAHQQRGNRSECGNSDAHEGAHQARQHHRLLVLQAPSPVTLCVAARDHANLERAQGVSRRRACEAPG